MNFDAPTITGWIGMVLLLVAYGARRKLNVRPYCLLNLGGAGALAVACYASAAWPAFALQCIWGVIAVRDLATASDKPEA